MAALLYARALANSVCPLVTALGEACNKPSTLKRLGSFRPRHHSKASAHSIQWVDDPRTPSKRRPRPLYAVAMDKMKVSEDEILEGKKRFERGEMFLGKEEIPGVSENVEDAEPAVGEVPSEIRECWEMWQNIGLPIDKISKQRNMTEAGVLFCIFACIQKNYTVDWYELCKEAKFTTDIAKRMIQCTNKFVSESKGGPVDPQSLRACMPPDISEVHFVLYVTMLNRGLPYDTILNISVPTGKKNKGDTVWGDIYASMERFPTDVTEESLLKWLSEKNGASLMEITLKFRDCDDLELMRLILNLEEEGKLLWRRGIFRAA